MKRRIILGAVGVLIGYLIYLVIYFLTLEPINAVLGAAIPLVIGAVFFLAGGKPAVQASSVSAAADGTQVRPRPSYSIFIFFLVVILVGGALMVSILGGSLQLLSGLH